jgi:hypothetical protein
MNGGASTILPPERQALNRADPESSAGRKTGK